MTISRRSFVSAALAAIAGGAAAAAAAAAAAVPVAIATPPARKKVSPETADKIGRWLRSTFYVNGRPVTQQQLDAMYAPRRFTAEEICRIYDVPPAIVGATDREFFMAGNDREIVATVHLPAQEAREGERINFGVEYDRVVTHARFIWPEMNAKTVRVMVEQFNSIIKMTCKRDA
jgi:hypothetical protein